MTVIASEAKQSRKLRLLKKNVYTKIATVSKIHGLYVPGKGYLRTSAGDVTTKESVIAGKGSGAVFRKAYFLSAIYGGIPENWQKMRGEIKLICDGIDTRAEVHWAREKSVGDVEEKFCRWLR